MRMRTVKLSRDRRVHGSAARERRKNNKIINNNKNKMMKTLPKSKDSPAVRGSNDKQEWAQTVPCGTPLDVGSRVDSASLITVQICRFSE